MDESEISTPEAFGRRNCGVGNHRSKKREIREGASVAIRLFYHHLAKLGAVSNTSFWKNQSDAIFVASCEEHALALHPSKSSRGEIDDVGQLFANELLRLFPLCNAGNNRAYTPANRRITEINRAFY